MTIRIMLAITLMAGLAFGQAITFTGDAQADFAGATVVNDQGGTTDVGLPAVLVGAQSGWDIRACGLSYDAVTDTFFVGLDFVGIAGDADGDGDPDGTSMALAGIGGNDNINWAGSEAFTFGLDLNDDGNLDVVCGTLPGQDISSFTLATFSPLGSIFAPQFAFDMILPANQPVLFSTPSAANPDIEFTIPNFSNLLAMFATPGLANIGIHAFAGSQEDAGIGEDYLPATFVQPVPEDNFPCLPVINQYKLEENTFDMQTGESNVVTSYGLPSGYGCCVFISLELQQIPIPITSVPGTPTLLVGTFGDPNSICVLDLGVPPVVVGAASCKFTNYTIPASFAQGTTFYAQVLAYPAFGQNTDFYFSDVLEVVVGGGVPMP